MLIMLMRTCGPLLVSHFEVYSDFLNDNLYSYSGGPQGDYKGRHTMLMVGFHQMNGKLVFLLQNWWKKKQFVEVNKEYLERCGGDLHYIKTPQSMIPKTFETNPCLFAETVLDIPEGFEPET